MTENFVKGVLRVLTACTLVMIAESCRKETPWEADTDLELSFVAVPEEAVTRGFVSGVDLSEGDVPRDLIVSAHLYGHNGQESDYFRGETFSCIDGRWTHTPALYWPLGSRMDFLIWSSGTVQDSVEWSPVNVADKVRMYVGEKSTGDDILFASLWGETADGCVEVGMYHAQSWIHLEMVKDDERVEVSSVKLKDVYTSGTLVIINNYGNAEAEWNFRTETGHDVDLVLTPDILLPEQERTVLEVIYVSGGLEHCREIAFPHSRWVMGRKYNYELEFRTDTLSYGVTVEPWQAMDREINIQ